VPTSHTPGPAREWPSRLLVLLCPERHIPAMPDLAITAVKGTRLGRTDGEPPTRVAPG
jgi:hypothetical protein